MSIVPSVDKLGTDKATELAASPQGFDLTSTAYGLDTGVEKMPPAIASVSELDAAQIDITQLDTTDLRFIETLSSASLDSANITSDSLTGLTGDELSGTANSSETVYGELSFGDDLNALRKYRFKDDFVLNASAGERITLDLVSSDFDTYLQLIDINNSRVLSDDDGGVGANSQLEFVVQESGTYIVRVTSYQFLDRGDYALTATRQDYAPPAEGFTLDYGYGLVDAAAAVAAALGQPAFSAVPNLGGQQWGNDMVNAPEAWAMGYTGQNVTVAVIDSGVDINHEDLRDNLWVNTGEIEGDGIDNDGNGYIDDYYGWNFGTGQNNGNVAPGTSSYGQAHGTHVAGTIAAGNNGFGMTGVAYDANIMSIRMGDVNSSGAFTNAGNLAQAIIYAVDNGADVINMSLGWFDSDGSIEQALAYAASRNVIAVSAAGNSSAIRPGAPASYATDYGISVGSVTASGSRSSFSNQAGWNSNMHHVMAPGSNIYSTMPNDGYSYMSGTSMAAPHVAGVVALMLSANPNLTHDQVRSILINTATFDELNTNSVNASVEDSAEIATPTVPAALTSSKGRFGMTRDRAQQILDWNATSTSFKNLSGQYRPTVSRLSAWASEAAPAEDNAAVVANTATIHPGERPAEERFADTLAADYAGMWQFQIAEDILIPAIA